MDAWVIWDPFLAAAEHQLGAQLADGVGLVSNHQFYLASRRYAEQNGKVIKLIVEELARLDAWARQNFKDVAGQLSSQIGLDVNIVRVAAERGTYDVRLLDAKVIAEQQRIADVFHQLKLIPKPLSVKDIVWSGQ